MEGSGPAACDDFDNMGGRGEMRKAPIKLRDLRRRIYVKAKAEKYGATCSPAPRIRLEEVEYEVAA